MECTEEARRYGRALPGLLTRSARGITLLGQSATDALASVDHVVRLLVAGRVVAVIAEAETLEEMGKVPRLLVGQYNLDLDLYATADRATESLAPGQAACCDGDARGLS